MVQRQLRHGYVLYVVTTAEVSVKDGIHGVAHNTYALSARQLVHMVERQCGVRVSSCWGGGGGQR